MNSTTSLEKNIFYPPGGILIWIIIALELGTFGGAFVFYFFQRAENYELFKQSQNFLNRDLAAINTLVLIISGYFAANAVLAYKAGKRPISIRNFRIAAFLGFLFVAFKCFEYYEKVVAGKLLGENLFFDFYWMLTGFHVVHVLLGIGLLLGTCLQIRDHKEMSDGASNVYTVASFWHLCDLIWVFLFPVIYLI